MRSEAFVVEQYQLHAMEIWPDEPGEKAELAWERSDSDPVCRAGRLEKLPASPFRSVGGYLNYAGWPDCQRFLELDRAIQLQAHESQNAEEQADLDDRPAQSSLEDLEHSSRLWKQSPSATRDAKDWARISLADFLIELEDLPLRRL